MARQNGDSAALWLAILKEGGRSTSGEAAAATGRKPTGLNSVLDSLARAGSLRKYPAPAGHHGVRFGVTADCIVPHGVSVADILACKLTGD